MHCSPDCMYLGREHVKRETVQVLKYGLRLAKRGGLQSVVDCEELE